MNNVLIHRVHPNKSPFNSFEKRERGRIQGLPKFFGYPYYLNNGESYGFQIWQVHSQGLSEQKPTKIFEKRERGRIQRLSSFFGYPYYLRNG